MVRLRGPFPGGIPNAAVLVKQRMPAAGTSRGWVQLSFKKGRQAMAICENCGKKTTFGRNRPWSKKATRRTFHPNLQNVSVFVNGRKVRKVLCAKCIRTLVKTD